MERLTEVYLNYHLNRGLLLGLTREQCRERAVRAWQTVQQNKKGKRG